MESVRPATRADADACAELCRRALQELSAVRGGVLFTRRETGLLAKALMRPGGLDRLLSDNRRIVVVGLVDDAIVGFGIARAESVGEGVHGILDACFVDPEVRGVGVGRAILDMLTGWLASRGCKGVDAQALPGQRETKSFYEAAGFKARLITMHREIP
ncbi:MAG: GNAT family N-acetyltransferase [Acidimicrobiales bacterium]|jgi:GNAT superfamily N-acetyltransferase